MRTALMLGNYYVTYMGNRCETQRHDDGGGSGTPNEAGMHGQLPRNSDACKGICT